MRKRRLPVSLFPPLFALAVPTQAWANVGIPYFSFSLRQLIVAYVLVTILEAVLLKFGLRLTPARALGVSAPCNLVTTILGVPLFGGLYHSGMMGMDMIGVHPFLLIVPGTLLAVAGCFILSWLGESLLATPLLPEHARVLPRVLTVMAAANLASYVLLVLMGALTANWDFLGYW